jgi:hypothetical protein
MNDLKGEGSICPECGAKAEATWVMCDGCGVRLPWAPVKKIQRSLGDLSDEELAARFAAPRDNEVSDWTFIIRTFRGRVMLVVIVLLLLFFIRNLFGF